MLNFYKLILIISFLTVEMTAQNFDDLKSRDTIFLLFDKNQQAVDLHLKVEEHKVVKSYTYIFPDAKYLNFLTYLKGTSKRENFEICQKDLMNKKLKIMRFEDIHISGFDKIIYLIHSKKVIVYIIDSENYKRRKVRVSRAYIRNLPIIIM